ncbi:MAG: A24 family peptidase [Pseudomonadota bacterium]
MAGLIAVFEMLNAQPALLVVLSGVLGLLVGSFLNVVIHRLPHMMERELREQCAWLQGEEAPADAPAFNLFWPPSTCPHCGHRIRWYENIPLVSWLYLRGRCSACQAGIAARYPLVELLTGGFFALAASVWSGLPLVWVWVFLSALLALTFIDFDTHLLPDSVTLPLVWLGLLANMNGVFVTLEEAVVGAVAGYLSLWSVYWLFRLLTGKEGMGFGDFKLLAAIGAWLGWKLLLPVVLVASVAGALIGGTLMLLRRQERDNPIPFGPWLALGGVVALFNGPAFLRFWLG